MDREKRPTDWYAGPVKDWYAVSSPAEGGEGKKTKKPRKKRTGMKITMIIVCVLILVAGSALIFSDGGQKPAGPGGEVFATPTPNTGSSGQGEESTPPDQSGESEGEEGEGEYEYWDGVFDDDFHDFFGSYYLPQETPGESYIKRADTDSGVELKLNSCSGREKLSLGEIYDRCIDSIVGIIGRTEDGLSYSWGTGIIMTRDGYILTNAHVIEGCTSANVMFSDGSEMPALLVGEDPQTDLAVLKVAASGLMPAEFGISDELSVGDDVVAIGNPLGIDLSGTMTNGIVSAINRDVSYDGRSMSVIQTNAALNEGNSGGPLINMYGQVIGITNMKMAAGYSEVTIEGIGFAIPSSFAKNIVDKLIASGEVTGRPGMGITVGAIPVQAAQHYSLPEGLYILEVSPGSDAEKQGVLPGDVLTHVNGTAVYTTDDVLVIRDQHFVGDVLTLTLFRDGQYFDVDIELYDINSIY